MAAYQNVAAIDLDSAPALESRYPLLEIWIHKELERINFINKRK